MVRGWWVYHIFESGNYSRSGSLGGCRGTPRGGISFLSPFNSSNIISWDMNRGNLVVTAVEGRRWSWCSCSPRLGDAIDLQFSSLFSLSIFNYNLCDANLVAT